MARKYNSQQARYIAAQSLFNLMENTIKHEEEKFLKIKGVVNPDGSVPKRLYAVDNEALFDLYNNEFASLITESGLWDEYLHAKDELKQAENELIAYALSIIPKKISKTLSESARINCVVREKIIHTVLKFDTSTLK